MNVQLVIDVDQQLERVTAAAMPAIRRELSRAVNRAAHTVAAEEKDIAPQGYGTLVNSINVMDETPLTRLVGPSVHYAENIVNGREPGGAPPPQQAIEDWIKIKGITSTKYRTTEDLAKAMGFSIAQRGIEPNDFVQETVNETGDIVQDIIFAGVDRALSEVGL